MNGSALSKAGHSFLVIEQVALSYESLLCTRTQRALDLLELLERLVLAVLQNGR